MLPYIDTKERDETWGPETWNNYPDGSVLYERTAWGEVTYCGKKVLSLIHSCFQPTCRSLQGILVSTSSDAKSSTLLVVTQPAPAWALHCHCGSRHLLLHLLEGAKVPLNGLHQLPYKKWHREVRAKLDVKKQEIKSESVFSNLHLHIY